MSPQQRDMVVRWLGWYGWRAGSARHEALAVVGRRVFRRCMVTRVVSVQDILEARRPYGAR